MGITKRNRPMPQESKRVRILTRVTEEYNAAEAAANPRVGFTAEDAPTETTALVSLSKPVSTLDINSTGSVRGVRVSGNTSKRLRKRFSSLVVKNKLMTSSYAKRVAEREARDRIKVEQAKLNEMSEAIKDAERRRHKQKEEARAERIKAQNAATGQKLSLKTLKKLTPKQLKKLHRM